MRLVWEEVPARQAAGMKGFVVPPGEPFILADYCAWSGTKLHDFTNLGSLMDASDRIFMWHADNVAIVVNHEG